jgi:hypothetical protein
MGDSASESAPKATSQTSDKAQRVYKQKFLVDKSTEGKKKQSQAGETRRGGGADVMAGVLNNLF